MAPSRASRRAAPPPGAPPAPPLSLLVLTATLAALALATPAVQAQSDTIAVQSHPTGAAHPATGAARGVHVPLLRRNGHLRALARTPSQQDQHDIVAGWALREKDRLAVKYGLGAASTTAADLKRRGDDSEAESPQDNDDDDEGVRGKRKGRRRVTGLQYGEAQGDDSDSDSDDAWSIARRQLAGPNGGQLGTTASSSSSDSSTTRTALSTAGYGTAATATRTSGESSGSVNSATRTAPTTFPGPTQTVPVGDVHLLNYDADL